MSYNPRDFTPDKISEKDYKLYQEIVKDGLGKYSTRINSWETNFLKTVNVGLFHHKEWFYPSDRQKQILSQIKEKLYRG